MIFAWVGVLTMVRPIVAATPLVLPWGQLLIVVLVAAAAGLLASVLPARRGARVLQPRASPGSDAPSPAPPGPRPWSRNSRAREFQQRYPLCNVGIARGTHVHVSS